jgi:hypothetical protein
MKPFKSTCAKKLIDTSSPSEAKAGENIVKQMSSKTRNRADHILKRTEEGQKLITIKSLESFGLLEKNCHPCNQQCRHGELTVKTLIVKTDNKECGSKLDNNELKIDFLVYRTVSYNLQV